MLFLHFSVVEWMGTRRKGTRNIIFMNVSKKEKWSMAIDWTNVRYIRLIF